MAERQCASRRAMLASICALAVSACAPPPPPSSYAQTDYAIMVGKPVVTIDPATGDKVRTTHWRFSDGYNTTTVDRIPVGGDNDFRRDPKEPPPRVVVVD